MANQTRINLLQAEVDENDQSFFRLLVDGQAIKYITEDMCFGPSLASLLPRLPTGDWNDGLVARDEKDGQPCFTRACRTAFPGVKDTWHGTYADCTDIVVGEKLRTGIYEVKGHMFGPGDAGVAAKFARFDWEIQYIENETTVYQWIDGHNIGPRFLGHLTEDARVIGFLMERIQDLEPCQQTLSRLHCLGIRHGDITISIDLTSSFAVRRLF